MVVNNLTTYILFSNVTDFQFSVIGLDFI